MHLMYTRPDGGVTIVHAAAKAQLDKEIGPLTDKEYKDHVYKISIPSDALNVQEISADVIPEDREFRNAWIQNNNKIEHDLLKAKELQLDRVRKAREPKLKDLDTKMLLALENNDDIEKAKILTAKKALRDITEPLKQLSPITLKEIKEAFPKDLK